MASDSPIVEPGLWRLAAAAAALVALTATLGWLPSTRVVGADRVPDPLEDASGWRLRGDDGGVSELASDGGIHLMSGQGQRAVAWFDLGKVGDHARWRLRGRVKAPRPARVKVVLAATDGDRRLWFGSYGFESDDFTDVDVPVNAPLQGLDVSVGVRMRGEAGEAWLRRMSLVPVQPRADWLVGLGVLVAGWLGWWWTLVRRVGWLPGAVVLSIAAGVTAPRSWVDLYLGRFAGTRLFDTPLMLWVQKLGGHAGMFGLLGAALATRFSPAVSLGIVVGLGVASEALQLVSVARSASLFDVGLDVVGGAVGVGLATWWRGGFSRRSAPPAPPASGASRP